MSESEWLDSLYAVARSGGDRAAMLRTLADVRVSRPLDWDYAGIRAAFDHDGAAGRLTDPCFVCLNADRWLYWHHVIQVQNGGSNDTRNLVRLCHRCHKTVHPWLADEARPKCADWFSVGGVALSPGTEMGR